MSGCGCGSGCGGGGDYNGSGDHGRGVTGSSAENNHGTWVMILVVWVFFFAMVASVVITTNAGWGAFVGVLVVTAFFEILCIGIANKSKFERFFN